VNEGGTKRYVNYIPERFSPYRRLLSWRFRKFRKAVANFDFLATFCEKPVSAPCSVNGDPVLNSFWSSMMSEKEVAVDLCAEMENLTPSSNRPTEKKKLKRSRSPELPSKSTGRILRSSGKVVNDK
jgi:hypothetical protein